MESLDASCAAQIAGWLLDERDLAALRCANRFWSGVLTDNPGLWSGLITRRFGAAAHAGQTGAAGAAPAGAAAAGGAAAAADPERRFRQLAAAALQRPVAALERLIWLDGQHLQVGMGCSEGAELLHQPPQQQQQRRGAARQRVHQALLLTAVPPLCALATGPSYSGSMTHPAPTARQCALPMYGG